MKINGIKIEDGDLLVVEMKNKNGNGETKKFNMTVVHDTNDNLGCHSPQAHEYWPIDCFDENGVFVGEGTATVLAIYGRTYNAALLDNSTEGRDLLWERKKAKKMTVAEICEALGYEIEIVKE